MNKINYLFVTVVMCTLTLMLTSCQQDGPAEKVGKNVDQTLEEAGKKIDKTSDAIKDKVNNAAASLDDATITAKIKAAIITDPLLKVSKIDVVTADGAVQLSGTVDSQLGVDRAQEIATGIKNVSSVKNSLAVKIY